jgi:hypothetical protein
MNNNSRRLKPEELQIDRTQQPEWQSAEEAPVVAGSVVLCTAGLAQVVKVCGKTGNGSRLLELRLAEGDQHSFFAAASNVLVRPAV